jgi:plasmid stability protein
MHKTTVYLPDDLREALRIAALASGKSEAELIREGIASVIRAGADPAPTLPLFRSGLPSVAHDVDAELASGFGAE